MSDAPQSKGGVARAAALTPEQRSAVAKRAAAARWGNPAPDPPAAMIRLNLSAKAIPGFKRLRKAIDRATKAAAELQLALDELGIEHD